MTYIVVSSAHKTPRYHIARQRIGGGFAIVANSHSETIAREIAQALNMLATPTAQVIPIKKSRKRA